MKYSGAFLIVLAAMFWGISGAIANVLLNKGWDPLVIAFYRGVVGLVFFLLWTLISSTQNERHRFRFYLWSLLAGAGVAGNFVFYFLSIEAASISIAATLMYSAPVFVLLTSLLIGLERPGLFKWVSVAMVLIGIVLLTESHDLASISTSVSGTLFGLASGVSYAVFIFGFKKASAMGSTKWVLFVSFLMFSGILILIMDLVQARDVLFSSDLGWFLTLGILGGGLSFILYVIGLRTTLPSTASIIALIEPVTATIIGVLFLNNVLSFSQGLGMALILVTVGLLKSKGSDQTMNKARGHDDGNI
ncbi:MAG: DMT family transporter [Candidatus Izemoplasmataceae bacterium]